MRTWLSKAWSSFLRILEHPADLPFYGIQVLTRGVHAGELLRMLPFRNWLQGSHIRTVIDVGANIGQFASAIQALIPEARIYSFEPIKACYERLERRFRHTARFKAFRTALGNTDGVSAFRENRFSASSSVLPMTSLHKKTFPQTAKDSLINVNIKPLDNFYNVMELKRKILLKIDVQGYEFEVLKGASEVLKQIDYLLVEVSFENLYERQASFDDLYRFLYEKGFTYCGEMGHYNQSGRPLQADALFIRDSNHGKV